MMPSCDQTGVPIHFHSSTTPGSASLMSLRILPRVTPRQSPRSAILFEMSSDAGWPWLEPEFFMLSSWMFLEQPFERRQHRRLDQGRRVTDAGHRNELAMGEGIHHAAGLLCA